MKIALFSESYTPYISGVSRSVELARSGLEALGHEVFVFTSRYPGHKETEKNIIRFPSVPAKYPGFRTALPLPFIIPDTKFDIVHSNSPFGLGLLAKRLAKKSRAPYVYTFHTLFSDYLHYIPLPKMLSEKALFMYMRWFCAGCDKIIVPNTFTLGYVKRKDISGDFAVVPSGVDIQAADAASASGVRARFGISDDDILLLYVGRLSKEKNIPFLLNAFRDIRLECPKARLLLAAGGPEENALKKLSSDLDISDSTVFAGQVPYPEILNIYRSADVFIFASKTETQGLVIAEAKACGLPVVAVDAGGIKESLVNGEDGFLVAEDLGIFREKAVLLCKNAALRSEMSKKARANSIRDFSSSSVAKKLGGVYNSLLKEKIS